MKQNKNIYYISVAVIALIITTASVVTIVSAQEGGDFESKSNKMGKGLVFNEKNHEAMIQALENKDYQAWKELAVNTPLADKITEENFAKFAEANLLMKEGKFEEAKALREELGFNVRLEKGFGDMHQMGQRGRGEMKFDSEKQTAIQEAIESGDYNAWKELEGNNKITEQITEENFAKFVEMQKLRIAGDKDGAKLLADELGLKQPQRRGDCTCTKE